MLSSIVLRGDARVVHREEINKTDAFILDVRDPDELEGGYVEGAVNIPLNDLRARIGDIPMDREISVYCFVGQRSYYAARMLMQQGFDVKTLSEGSKLFLLHNLIQPLNARLYSVGSGSSGHVL